MSPTSAARPRNPGGVARRRARCAHLSFPSPTVFRVITSPGHRTQHTHHAPPGIISSRLASSAVRIPANVRACPPPAEVSLDGIRCLARRRCTGVSVFHRDQWPVGGTRTSRRDTIFSCHRLVLHTRTSRRRPLRLLKV